MKDSSYTGIDGLYDTLGDHKDHLIKWDYSPISEVGTTATIGTKDVFKPGMTQAEEAKTFMTALTENTTFLDNSRVMPLTTNEMDFENIDQDGKLWHMSKLDKGVYGAQIDDIRDRPEVMPTFGRKILKCEPFFGRTHVTWRTIKENIMGEQFVPFYQDLAVGTLKRNMEYSVTYGIKVPTPTTGTAMESTNGLLQQLKLQRSIYDANKDSKPRTAKGYYGTIDFATPDTKDPCVQIQDMITQYMIQGGNRKSAKLYMGSEAESEILQSQQTRKTERGDAVYFDDNGTTHIWGVPVVHADTLDFPVNGWKPQMILGDLNGYVVGTKQDITTESKWDLFSQAYHMVTKVYYGTLLLEPAKILSADIMGMKTQDATTGVVAGNASESGNNYSP